MNFPTRSNRMSVLTIKVTIPRHELNESSSPLDRIVMATALFIDLMEGVPSWRVVRACYDEPEPWIMAEIHDTRFRGLNSGRAIVDIIRLDSKPSSV
jgi:hypothetical protein